MTLLRGLLLAAFASSFLAACVSTGMQPYGDDTPLRSGAELQGSR